MNHRHIFRDARRQRLLRQIGARLVIIDRAAFLYYCWRVGIRYQEAESFLRRFELAVTVNANGTAHVESLATYTNLTIASGSNTVLVMILLGNGTVGTPSATWNGVSLSQIGTTVTNATSGRSVLLFGLLNPATGNQTLSYTNGSFTDWFIHCVAFDGVDTSSFANAFQHYNSATGNDTTPSVVITTANGNAVVSAATAPVGSGTQNKTALFGSWVSGGGSIDGAAQREAPSGSSTTHQWTIASSQWAIAGVDIVASGAGGPTAAQLAGIWSEQNAPGIIGRVDA